MRLEEGGDAGDGGVDHRLREKQKDMQMWIHRDLITDGGVDHRLRDRIILHSYVCFRNALL